MRERRKEKKEEKKQRSESESKKKKKRVKDRIWSIVYLSHSPRSTLTHALHSKNKVTVKRMCGALLLPFLFSGAIHLDGTTQ